MPSGAASGANATPRRSDFPLYRLADNADRESPILYETNDVMSSQGAFLGTYTGLFASDRNPNDRCDTAQDPIYHVGGENTRRVEPRNTPTVINAAFNIRNFWDGRATNVFNGSSPFGRRDPAARVVSHDGAGFAEAVVDIPNLSLASQAVGPTLSELEMICAGRTLAELGRKVMGRQPLAQQKVHRQDGVLGPHFNRLT
ncbi:MAG: cytochrome c peroxidase, partial [Pseudomonadota bacterium]